MTASRSHNIGDRQRIAQKPVSERRHLLEFPHDPTSDYSLSIGSGVEGDKDMRRNLLVPMLSSQKKAYALVGALIFIIAAFIGFECVPLFDSPATLSLEYNKTAPTALPPDYIDELNKVAGTEIPLGQAFIFDMNWLVSSSYQLYGSIANKQIHWRQEMKPFIRRERFVIVILALSLIVSGIFVYKNVADPARDGSPVRQWNLKLPKKDEGVEEALLVEMNNAWFVARRFYNWSLYLLGSGVVMAFFGMGVFILTMPSQDIFLQELDAADFNWKAYALASARPFGLLIFMEAIAWFLLRQYRSATEDFKAFHRVYLRRSNYFSARMAFSETKSEDKSTLLGMALLTEDLSGRLTQGQTTEAIEAMKTDEANPVFGIFSDLVRKAAPKTKIEGSKEGKAT